MHKRATLILLFALLANRALPVGTNVWNGGDGLWTNVTCWSLGRKPNSTDTIIITNGAVEYVPGGDLSIESGGSLTVGTGGRFFQTGGIAWMQIAGTILVDGGEFDGGTAAQMNLSGSLIVSSGVCRVRATTLNFTGSGILRLVGGTTYYRTGNFTPSARVSFEGDATLDITGEFQFTTGTHARGVIRTPKIAPQTTSQVLTLTGGHILATGSGDSGFWQPSGCYINFADLSTGKVTFTNTTPANAYSRYFSGATPRLRLAGAAISAADMTNSFDVVESAVPGMPNSVDISLKQIAAGAATFVADSGAAGGLTATSVVLTATIDDPGSPAADVYACSGTNNGALVFGAWAERTLLGTAAGGVSYTNTVTLNRDTVYYYRLAASNESGIAFASMSPAFVMTAPVAVTGPVAIAENSVTPAAIILSRPATNNCAAVSLSVPFTLGGTATQGTHYTLSIASPATIPAGANSVTVTLTPIADWASHTERTVEFTVQNAVNYLAPVAGSATITLLDATLPAYPTNAFLGVVSEDAAVPENWSLGVAPAADHVILFSPAYARRQMAWTPGATNRVARWEQPDAFPQADYRVLFHATPDSPLTIAGDCELQSGYWIHSGPSATPSNAVAVNIQGSLTVGAGAQINAGNGVLNQANGATRGYYLAGPGYLPSVGAAGTGSSYGGEGATNDITYGSILNPLSYGSSGRGDNANFAGGGLIVLNVAGTTTLNGNLLAKGFGYPGTGRGASTGGSINLTTRRLLGNGTISVDGGSDTGYGSGSGGRIRVKLTDPSASFSEFTGAMTAFGNAGTPGSAAGTITRQTAADADSAATVIVDNNSYSDATNAPFRAMCTHLPPRMQTDALFTGTTWVLRRYASLRLTANTRIQALKVEGTTPRIFTETFVLSTKEFVVNGSELPSGTYTAAQYPDLLKGSGSVVVEGSGTLILLR